VQLQAMHVINTILNVAKITTMRYYIIIHVISLQGHHSDVSDGDVYANWVTYTDTYTDCSCTHE